MVITVGLSLENVDFSRIFFSCVFNTLPIHQLIIIAGATRSSRTPKKRRPSCWSEIARGATRRADAWWWFPFSSCLSPRLFGHLFFVSFPEREEKIGKQKMPTTTRLLRGRLLRGGILAFFFTCALLKIATTLPSETATKGGGIETDDEGGFAWKVERRVLLRSGRTSRKSTPSFMSRHTHAPMGSSSSPLRERSWSRDEEDGGGSETADDAAEKKKKRRRRNNKKDDKKDKDDKKKKKKDNEKKKKAAEEKKKKDDKKDDKEEEEEEEEEEERLGLFVFGL